MCSSLCVWVWIRYWLLIWATWFPRRVKRATVREWSWDERSGREKSSRLDGNDGPAGQISVPVRSDSVTRSWSSCLSTSLNLDQYSKQPCRETCFCQSTSEEEQGQIKPRQDNMQVNESVRIFFFFSASILFIKLGENRDCDTKVILFWSTSVSMDRAG